MLNVGTQYGLDRTPLFEEPFKGSNCASGTHRHNFHVCKIVLTIFFGIALFTVEALPQMHSK